MRDQTLTLMRSPDGGAAPEASPVNELRLILDEMTDIDLRLATPGVLVSAQRDELLARRRNLQARFDGLQQRPDYLSQIDAYADGLGTSRLAFPA